MERSGWDLLFVGLSTVQYMCTADPTCSMRQWWCSYVLHDLQEQCLMPYVCTLYIGTSLQWASNTIMYYCETEQVSWIEMCPLVRESLIERFHCATRIKFPQSNDWSWSSCHSQSNVAFLLCSLLCVCFWPNKYRLVYYFRDKSVQIFVLEASSCWQYVCSW